MLLDSVRVLIFPLNTVLFRGGLLRLGVSEARYMDMTRECLKRDEPFGVCLIHQGSEVGAPAVPEGVGCLAKIQECDMQQQGILNLKTRGSQRFRILERETSAQGLISAGVGLIEPDASVAVPEEFSACTRLLEMVVADQGKSVFAEPHAFDDAARSEEHTSELQSPCNLVCRLLLEKKKKKHSTSTIWSSICMHDWST